MPALAWLSWYESQPRRISRLVPVLISFTVSGESLSLKLFKITVKIITMTKKTTKDNYNRDLSLSERPEISKESVPVVRSER